MNAPGAPDEEPRSGADNYLLGPEIARGGMGSILEAEDRKLARTVAVKVLLPDSDADTVMTRRFIREARVLSLLAHPNIVPIHDIVWEGGAPLFYTMKLVKGRTLQAILDGLRSGNADTRRDYTLDRLLTVFRKVCDAIAFAHSKGVLHRDLKPENIMVGEFGEVLVMDWGVAKILATNGEPDPDTASDDPGDSSVTSTKHGAVIGTPHFMSPEQARGAIAEHDERSDIFSLGAILYAILTLRPPVGGTTKDEVLKQIASAQITPPDGAQFDPDGAVIAPSRVQPLPHCPHGRVPAALSAVAMKALALERARRYQAVAELASDVEAYQGGFATSAEHAGLLKEFQLLVLRHKLAASLLAALLLASLGFVWRVTASERRAEAERDAARAALTRSAISLAESALREGNGPAMQAALDDVPADRRDDTWRYLRAESDPSRLLPDIGVTSIEDIAAHPRLAGTFAAAGGEGKIVIFNARDGARLVEFMPGFSQPAPGAVPRIAFSRTGDRIAIGRSGRGGIVVHDAADGRKLAEWGAPPTGRVEFSPNGTLLLQTAADGAQVDLWNVATGAHRWTEKMGYQLACFGSAGANVAIYGWGAWLRTVKTADASPVFQLSKKYVTALAAQPGGRLLVVGDPLGYVRGFDLTDGTQRFEFQPHESQIDRVAFTSGGERFLTAATLPDGRQALQLWDATSTRACQTLLGGSGAIRGLALHPLSGELIVCGHDVRVWHTLGEPTLRILRNQNPHPSAVFWGSADVFIGPAPGNFSAGIRDLAAPLPGLLWKPETLDHGQPSVSADGRRAAIGRYHSPHAVAVVQRNGPGVAQVASLEPRWDLDFVRLSPNGDRVAAVGRDFTEVEIFDVATGTRPVALDVRDIRRISDLAWLDGGKTLAGLVTVRAPRGAPGSAEEIILWDSANGRRLRSAGSAGITSVLCAAPDGRRFAEAGADRLVRIRDAGTLAVMREFRAHNAPLTALAWHPLRPILATASEDLSIRLWNLDDGTRLDEFRGPLSPPNVLSFSPDGRRLATAARDGAARIWEPRSLAGP